MENRAFPPMWIAPAAAIFLAEDPSSCGDRCRGPLVFRARAEVSAITRPHEPEPLRVVYRYLHSLCCLSFEDPLGPMTEQG
jgi:hypothetical protein